MTTEPNEPVHLSVTAFLSDDVGIRADAFINGDKRRAAVVTIGHGAGRFAAGALADEWPVIYRRLGDALRSAGVDLTAGVSDTGVGS